MVPDLILACLLFVLFLQISSNYLEFTGYYESFPHLVGSTSSLVFLYGPLIYLYVQSYISRSAQFKPTYLLHLVPFILYNLLLIPLFYIKSGPEKLAYHQDVLSDPPGLWLSVALVLKAITLPAYLIWALFLLRNHVKNIGQFFAHTEEIDLGWLRYLIWSMAVVGLVVMVLSFAKIASGVNIETEKYIFAIATFWIFGLGYYGLKQAPIFIGGPQTFDAPNNQVQNKSQAYQKNRVKAADADVYQKVLVAHMEKERPFLKNKLTLAQLAKETNIPSHHLSQILNERMKQNFFDFVNGYRIDEFKEQIKDPANQNFSILGVALNCGFNSKAAFNRIFKKHTGVTPSQYLEKFKYDEGLEP